MTLRILDDSCMTIAHLAASPFVGGPERQMLGLAASLPESYRTVFLAFANSGKSDALVQEARRAGHEAITLKHDAPEFEAAAREIARHLRRLRVDVLCCHGYKPDIIGWRAARQAGIPVVAVAHGWTAATFKVRVNEALDRLVLRWFDRVVCVSEGQAVKVRAAGIPARRVVVIRNAIGSKAFGRPDPAYGDHLHGLFAEACRHIIGAAGRLSPEKGFDKMIDAAEAVLREEPDTGFVIFGSGPLRQRLADRIADKGLAGRFVLAGFRKDLDRFLPHLDALVLPSFTEGLPVIVLEAFAAGVPVVASAVGGVPEIVEEGSNGYLVPPGHSEALGQRLVDLLADDRQARLMGERGRQLVRERFSLAAQSMHYQTLFQQLAAPATRLPTAEERLERAVAGFR